MKYSIHKIITFFLIAALAAITFGQFIPAQAATEKKISVGEKEHFAGKTPYRGSYSNMVDDASRREVRKALITAGISKKTVDAWLGDVKNYNKTIGNVSLVKKGFKAFGKNNPQYNEAAITTRWTKKYNMFIGYNCRITAYNLMKDFIKVGNNAKGDSSQLFMDRDALKYSPSVKFTKKQTKTFENIYSSVKTKDTTNVKKHLSIWQNTWRKNKVSFSKKTKAALISVVLHSRFSKTDNELFVGHTGVLVPLSNKKLLFVEKLSFELPYQAVKFDNRKQLNNYLMGMYDTEWGQKTAKPFILEDAMLMN